jgi:hypothetical protein
MPSLYDPSRVDPFTSDPVPTIVRLDGFRKLAEVDQAVTAALAASKSLFALIIGPTGTGRSAAAKYIFRRYNDLHEAPATRLIVPKAQPPNQSSMWTHARWFSALREQVDEAEIDVGALYQELTAFVVALAQNQAVMFEDDFRRFARRYSRALAGVGASYAVCMEDVPDWSIILSAFRIFDAAPVACVFTVKHYGPEADAILKAFRDYEGVSSVAVELSHLTAADVADFADGYWRTCPGAAVGPNPFDRDAVRDAFDCAFEGQHVSMIKARKLLGRLHQVKEELDADGPPWDSNRLGIVLASVMTE